MHESIADKLAQLGQKFAATGQDMASYLEGLLQADYLTYWDYIQLETLLSLQNPKTAYPDELIFVTYHQITELYFNFAPDCPDCRRAAPDSGVLCGPNAACEPLFRLAGAIVRGHDLRHGARTVSQVQNGAAAVERFSVGAISRNRNRFNQLSEPAHQCFRAIRSYRRSVQRYLLETGRYRVDNPTKNTDA